MSSETPTFTKPQTITGGCLCGSVRYRVDFPEDHDFIASQIWASWTPLRPPPPLKTFLANPDSSVRRFFCSACGSLLFWRHAPSPSLEIALGTVDPEFLFGSEVADGKGSAFGTGYALANGGGIHIWTQNSIRGVSDGGKMIGVNGGRKWNGMPDE
ncbi:glutathione-dependent formaldehyde-activating GFA [Zalerion maritima]|uniref:Glutathione-dependent formaldehyde-activating GFA n=1 Tax=Zalerion maritima TaxID=339359 RepID=A0AAD5RRZ9_9PEZI|nr:glutathione-dependent formaldehyde-activating GFA [Zalerion maritima]